MVLYTSNLLGSCLCEHWRKFTSDFEITKNSVVPICWAAWGQPQSWHSFVAEPQLGSHSLPSSSARTLLLDCPMTSTKPPITTTIRYRMRRPSIAGDIVGYGIDSRVAILRGDSTRVLKYCFPDHEDAVRNLEQEKKILAILVITPSSHTFTPSLNGVWSSNTIGMGRCVTIIKLFLRYHRLTIVSSGVDRPSRVSLMFIPKTFCITTFPRETFFLLPTS